ncbi:MAG: SPOR domain-containing protein [Paraglaciecola sp.]|uniref:SPOR domain-containing protein n=1 Tax=Paraglaciecola sp. TaxID=1920173 RepID=UPI00329874AF
MAASEFNNRLDYLISYSSQLVFVCSDKIRQQSQVVESFLAHQNEQADLALLTANELTPLVVYREKLFRQLISQSQKADFNRPLNQLLASLNNHNGPILISVFHAEKLPDKLVKELWDLVLQSRFANNKQHLNVLLMGLSNWAETTKASLGTGSKEQPIMLNSPIRIQQAEIDEFSDLETFIQDKRKKFAQRIEDRQIHDDESKPIYKKWAMTTLFFTAFLVVFSGILGWQYPGKVENILAYFSGQQTLIATPSETSTIHNKTELVAAPESQAPLQVTTKLADPIDQPNVKESITKDELITDWNSASARLTQQSNKILLQTDNIEAVVDVVDVPEVLNNDTTPLDETLAQQKMTEVSEATTRVNDYKVEDIVELGSMLDQPKLSVESVDSLTLDTMADSPDKTEQNPISGVLTATPELMLALPSNHYVIQIAAMANISILQEYVSDNQLSQQLWLYKTQRYGGDWYVLLKNQDFDSIEAARAEITTLSDAMLMNTPFVKRITQVKQEITSARR